MFKKTCLDFYKKKTIKRITNFYKINKHVDNQQIINNTKVPKLKKLLSKIDWKDLSNGIPGRFHGDLHFENIIVSSKKKFTFLDWRQNFGSNLNTGDIYYDYAKILHGLIVSHKIVTKKKFKININKNKVYFNIIRPHHLKIFENYFFKWLKENNLDVYRVKILTSLIFLNICSLHHYPYNNFLFYLGKLMLYKTLNEKD